MIEEVRGLGAPGLLLLTDGAFLPGRRLLYSFIMAALKRAERVHVFGFEIPEEEFRDGIPQEKSPSFTFHDGFSDPLDWEKSLASMSLRDLCVRGIRDRVGDGVGPVTIVLDSLSWILVRRPLPTVCHLLRELSADDTRVVALLHEDLHDPGLLRSVCLLADSVISLTDPGEILTARVIQRKRSGRVVTQTESFRVGDDLNLETVSKMEQEPEDTVQVDPTVNLTFNLRLTETERERKESATLPYIFTDSKKMSILQSSTRGSAKIFYDPEPTDDVDEDDPDDDLDV
ncbi:elongator complex protein 5 [Hyla sarda]|uniref:elongator complex protein 5 n=1 Tax=Hyla sarda TaxID=327740 RepID=UPI0024C4149F|nr:elongator complex protein 5 [Hyla sarda]